MNESIYYNVDEIHKAINSDSQISFQYYQWGLDKEMKLKRDGARYVVSPWALVFDDENYYMVAVEGSSLKHYRVDKMLHMSRLDFLLLLWEARIVGEDYVEANT